MMRLIGLAIGLLSAVAVAAAQDQKPEREGDTVSFELKTSIIFLKGCVNGTGDLNFIFDTGASVTILKPATARKLGLLKPGERTGGLLGMPAVKTVGSIGVGKALLKDLSVAIMAVPQADLPLTFQGISYDGILGYNYISQFVATLDYKAGTIKLEPSDYVPEDPFEAVGKPEPPEPEPAPPAVHVGISYATIGDDVANEIGVEGGVVVKAVAPDSPAAVGGLLKGDVIQEINGRRVHRAEDYQQILSTAKAGGVLKFSVIRDRKDIDLEVTAAERK